MPTAFRHSIFEQKRKSLECHSLRIDQTRDQQQAFAQLSILSLVFMAGALLRLNDRALRGENFPEYYWKCGSLTSLGKLLYDTRVIAIDNANGNGQPKLLLKDISEGWQISCENENVYVLTVYFIIHHFNLKQVNAKGNILRNINRT